MTTFRHLKAAVRLKVLAEHPFDLTAEGAVTPKRIDALMATGGNLKLFYAMERVSEEVMAGLKDLAQETHAVQKMADMQAGKVVNCIEGYESENRPALHTALRGFFGEKKSPAAELAYKELEKLKRFLGSIGDQFTDVIQIGIGGSELGPKAIYMALEAYSKKGRRVHFLSNVDPDDGAKVFRSVNLAKTLVVVVSKSGSTLETLTNEAFAKDKFQKAGLKVKDHFVAVTGEGSPMDDPAQYRESFYMWDYVGGRYSVTSMVGCVSLGFALGMERLLEFLRGASDMDKLALNKEVEENLPLLSALLGIWNRNFLGLPTVAVLPYSQALSRFAAHLQQLDMESNGKHIDKHGQTVDFETGPIIWGEPGTNGQHSFYQSLHQGTTIVPIEFIGFEKSQYADDVMFQGTTCQQKLLSNLFAQSIAFALGQKNENPNKRFLGNRPNRILFAERLDAYTMGMILAYYEHKVAYQGFIWNINSFDQEGVQLGKKLALQMIDQFENKGGFPLGEAYLKLIS